MINAGKALARSGLALSVAVGAMFAALALFGAQAGRDRADAMRDPAIRLVAYGCEGAAGPLYAVEESDLPPCRRVEPIRR